MFSPERVHHYQPTPETNEVRLVKVTPYVRVRNGDEPPLFLQNNEFWSEGGEHIPHANVPGWAWQQAKLCNPVVLKDANFTLDVDAILKRLSGGDEPASGDNLSITTDPAAEEQNAENWNPTAPRQSRRTRRRPVAQAEE